MKAVKAKTKKSMEPGTSAQIIAQKDFVICQNEYFREIKVGQDVSDVPACFHPNLITEGVIAQGKEQ